MYKGIFVTGTDTGVGKTIVTAGVALSLKNKGIDVGIMKPVSTGGIPNEDIRFLMDFLGLKENIELVNPVALKESLAPYVAAKIERKKINLNKIFTSYEKLKKLHDFIIVEGIGGVFVPILKNYFVADLIKDFKLPVIIVSRAGLGTINHTLMTINTLEQKKAKILGIVLNMFSGKDISEKTNPEMIEKLGKYPVLAKIEKDANLFKNKELLTKKFNCLRKVLLSKRG